MKIVLKKVCFSANALAGVSANLEAAAAVRHGRGDAKEDMLRWKVACGISKSRVDAAIAGLTRECREILAPSDTEEWRTLVAAKLSGLGDDATADMAEEALLDGGAESPAINARRDAFNRVKGILSRAVSVTVAAVEWDRVPSRLAGGFLRDLMWMFDGVPQDILDAAAEEAGTGGEDDE